MVGHPAPPPPSISVSEQGLSKTLSTSSSSTSASTSSASGSAVSATLDDSHAHDSDAGDDAGTITPSGRADVASRRPKLPARLSMTGLKLNLRRGGAHNGNDSNHNTSSSSRAASSKGNSSSLNTHQIATTPLGLLCVRVIAGRNLISKDRNGKSDPFLILRVGSEGRAESDCIKACLNPLWGQLEGSGTWGADQVDGHSSSEAFCVGSVWRETVSRTRIEVVLWDRDSFKRNEYMGEISFSLADWAASTGNDHRVTIPYAAPDNKPIWIPIETSRPKAKVSGELLVKLGWLGNPAPSPGGSGSSRSSKVETAGPSLIAIANAMAASASATISSSSVRNYAHNYPLTVGQETRINDALNEAVLDKKMSMFGLLNANSSDARTARAIRARQASTASDRVFTAPPNRGVGTLPLGARPTGSLSNELSNEAPGSNPARYASDSSEDEDEDDDDDDDANTDRLDDMTASSDASSGLDDTGDYTETDDNADARDYFDTALGMSDTPSALPPHMIGKGDDTLKPPAFTGAAGTASQPTTPGGTSGSSSKRSKLAIPGFLRRVSSAKNMVGMLASGGINPQNATHDTSVSSSSALTSAQSISNATTSTHGDDITANNSPMPSPGYRRKKFTRRKVKVGVDDSGEVGAVDVDDEEGEEKGKGRRRKRGHKKSQTGRRRKKSEYSPTHGLSTGATDHDYLGVVFIEVKGAKNLPRWRNMTRTGWDMDPFCIVSFGQKVFRTRVIRHSRNPVWDERLFFHVKRHEHAFQILFTLFDWDKISSNDYVGEVTLYMNELTDRAPKPEEKTGVFPVNAEGKIVGDELHDFSFTLGDKSADLEEDAKEKTTLQIRAKFTPYSALRQRFWRTYLKQYDTDDSETWSYVEIYSLLDSLGSTLTRATIESFFTRFGKTLDDALTVDEAVICLEDELTKPRSEKRPVDSSNFDMGGSSRSNSGTATPGNELTLADNVPGGGMTYTGEPLTGEPATGVPAKDTPASGVETLAASSKANANGAGLKHAMAITSATSSGSSSLDVQSSNRGKAPSRESSMTPSENELSASGNESAGTELEKLINIKTCPLCHKKLTKKAEVDLVSHLAVCASQDWSSLSSLTVANFVSTSQAHRKWFTKLVNKVSNGAYKLGADSANILVQNRITGQLEEEKMQVYVRVGIRLWYRAAGSSSRMEANRIKKLLRSMSVKQGVKFNSPESVAEIPRFIAFHGLNMAEVLDPIESFEHFNAFFYRKLKPGTRPAADPDDPTTLVSSADCRMTCFPTISEATNLWIKGRQFSIKKLLGKELEGEASRYEGGSLCIFRLAPQDYHRYHSPVDGKIGRMSRIAGEYYTVNPIAIRSGLDVYAENTRVIVPMDSPAFGRVMNVCIGAMMVGTICFTKEEGEEVRRAEEYGYFAFGGSTIVCIFEPKTVKFDEDLVANSRACIETLVRVGMRIGKRV